jgi:hypothetical protein
MKVVGFVVVGILLAVLVGWQLLGESGRERSAPAPAGGLLDEPTRAELDALRQALEAEIESRMALADEVARLREELLRFGVRPGAGGDSLSRAESFPGQLADEPAAERELDLGRPGLDDLPGEERPAFDDAALLAAGIDPGDAARLRERWGQFEMEKLDLAHRSAREGWVMSPRHRRELRNLEQALQEELGEESYDWLLFATGEPNRVVVRDVLDQSPAREAGLESGDAILRYDGRRIFRVGELRRATALGELGEFVGVEVLRKGQAVELYVPRGPLGVLLKTESRAPAAG